MTLEWDEVALDTDVGQCDVTVPSEGVWDKVGWHCSEMGSDLVGKEWLWDRVE